MYISHQTIVCLRILNFRYEFDLLIKYLFPIFLFLTQVFDIYRNPFKLKVIILLQNSLGRPQRHLKYGLFCAYLYLLWIIKKNFLCHQHNSVYRKL